MSMPDIDKSSCVITFFYITVLLMLFGCETTATSSKPIECYYWDKQGSLIEVDTEEVAHQFQQQAEAGDKEAQYIIAGWYYSGSCNFPKNVTKSLDFYRLSADQGHSNAQIRIASIYLYGSGVPQDVEQGLRWYRIAAEQGDVSAIRTLGNVYLEGELVDKDLDEAEKWYRLAHETYGSWGTEQMLDRIEKERDPAWREKEQIQLSKKHLERESDARKEEKDQISEIPDNVPWLIGDWSGNLGQWIEVTFKVEAQEAENFTGHASISGGPFSCKDSKLKLVPKSEEKYSIKLYGLACRGKGTLESQGTMLTGKIKFKDDPWYSGRVTLYKSGYGPTTNPANVEDGILLLLCLSFPLACMQ